MTAKTRCLIRHALFLAVAGSLALPLAAQDPPVHHNPFHDPENPSYEQLQKAEDGLAGFPVDKRGMPDWMKMLNEGLINPRAELRGTG